jgi:alanyl-tRNA synthetase
MRMTEMTSAQVRQSFLDFFEQRKHLIVPSASLIPQNDPTLLFTNAGMNQFKDYFLGLAVPPAPRVADSQKIMRVSGKHNDLEDVGPSPYHHTFFEMLGNWSFGDYYKEQAISWAWELLTKVWGLPKGSLYATVFKDEMGEIDPDDEAARLWKEKTDINRDHILFFGRKDNFWEMGETGPCGPCSEIHIDRGPEFCDRADDPNHACAVNGDCHRFTELWNLVFIQYNSLGDGMLEALPACHIDTGAGFERLVMVLQGGASNYDTDVFFPILRRTQQLAGHSDQQVREYAIPYRVIADHSRAAAFLISDGVLPGNVGRGYVLRMIIRRAARFGRKLGFTEPFLAQVAEAVVETMGGHYRELRDRREHILLTITQEEERFSNTLDHGLARLHQLVSQLPAGSTALTGEAAFDLYATYGLPLEITRDVVSELGYAVDEDEFRAALDAHRDLSGGSVFEEYGAQSPVYSSIAEELKAAGRVGAEGVAYDPYTATECEAEVLALIRGGQAVSSVEVGDEVELVLTATPFYVESGGQVSDTGHIIGLPGENGDGADEERGRWVVAVQDMRRPVQDLVVHTGRVLKGQPRVGDRAAANVDVERRMDIMRNHTATHLLHRGLRRVLGEHVQQAGSLVAPDRLRFDFTHPSALTAEEIESVSRFVNFAVIANHPLVVDYKAYAEALDSGVVALFGEKYGEIVRVVQIGNGDEPVSRELCGGTHVYRTGSIGSFYLTSEESVGAGLRRIEAVTGRHAWEFASARLGVLQKAADLLNCLPLDVDEKVQDLQDHSIADQRSYDKLKQELARRDFDRLAEDVEEHAGVHILSARVNASDVEGLRQFTDWFRGRYPSIVIVLGAVINDRPVLVTSVTPDLVERGIDASALVKSVAEVVGGGGGGRPTMAQAGGRDASRLDEALGRVPRLVADSIA